VSIGYLITGSCYPTQKHDVSLSQPTRSWTYAYRRN